MSDEKEILSILSFDEFKNLSVSLNKSLKGSKSIKRLSIQCTNYDYQNLDTRIRITNGKSEIMQKIGDWKSDVRQEISIPLKSDSDLILKTLKILRNITKGENIQTSIIQLENTVYKQKDFEIKLTHQFGKKDVYNCEIEVFDSKLDPKDIASNFNIPLHLPDHTAEFWKNWSESVNLSADGLSDKEMLEIISEYIKI
ncbi:MAG: hypothetical protein AAB546_01860 [Patescibacteria group bacterium]